MATMAFIQPRLINSNITGSTPLTRGGLNDFPGASLALLQSLAGASSYFKETASQSWTAGDLIYLDANGTLALATSTTAIAGQALGAASGVTARPVQFHVIRPDDVYVMNVYHGTAASAVTVLTQLANNSGAGWALTRVAGSSSRWCVDIENTTVEDGSTALARVMIIGFHPKGVNTSGVEVDTAIGDTYGLVRVKFVPFSIASDGTPQTKVLQLA